MQENGVAFVGPGESVDDFKAEFATEITRVRRLAGEEFVKKMKQKFKDEALRRMVSFPYPA